MDPHCTFSSQIRFQVSKFCKSRKKLYFTAKSRLACSSSINPTFFGGNLQYHISKRFLTQTKELSHIKFSLRIRIPDMSIIQMVVACPYAKWASFQMPSKTRVSVVSIDLFRAHFCSFLYSGVNYWAIRLSADEVIVSQKIVFGLPPLRFFLLYQRKV